MKYRLDRTATAQFIHDCTNCTYKGRCNGMDVYSCNESRTIVMRFGNSGPSYISSDLDILAINEPAPMACMAVLAANGHL
jgi:hypothetical protein